MLYLIALYASLADPRFEVRESATESLTALVSGKPWVYGPRLIALAREATEPEICSRVRRPIAAYDRWRVASYVPATVPVWPAIDCFAVPMMLGDRRCRCLGIEWMDHDVKVEHADPPYWHRYRHATERMARQMIRDGATAAEVDALLLRMWKVEQAHNGDCGAKWAESANWTRWQGGYPRPN